MNQRQLRFAKRMFREPNLPSDLAYQLQEKLQGLRSSVKTDYLKAEVFSKFVSDETDPPNVTRQRAINKWLSAERDNEATTDRLILTPEEYQILPRVSIKSFMEFCTSTIVDIIGESPPVDALIGSFSGGSSTSRSRTYSQPANKFYGKAHVTERCLEYFTDIVVNEVPGWINAQTSSNIQIELVPGNVMFTVPKKTDIDRVACKEPDLNMFIQKGIGKHFRACLRRTGINLNDQSINRSLALRGSIDGSLATLDLSSASDSVTTELVFQMLPVTWFTLLDAVRCQVTIIDGEEHRNHMFSSMGNGFTFELESLLFYVLARATAYFTGTRGVVSVYGDDIIIPTEIASLLTSVLRHFGFQVNPDKSHADGPFRESCGGHYWNGVDITPFYVRKPLRKIADLIDVANKLRHWGDLRIGSELFSSVIDEEVEQIWLWLKGFVPRTLWGGVDHTFKFQLVSHDTPSHRLYEVMKKKTTGNGGYPHWLNATWARTGLNEHVETSVSSISTNLHRLVPVLNKTVPRLEALFIHELERYMTEKT